MMRSPSFLLTSLVSFLGISSAVALPSLTRDTASSGCVNSPSNRSCWSDGFDISTNYYEHVPDTGVVREYWFNIENTTASPDGVEMPVQLINGSSRAQLSWQIGETPSVSLSQYPVVQDSTDNEKKSCM